MDLGLIAMRKYASREIIKLHDFLLYILADDDRKDPYYYVKPKVTIGYMQTLSDYARKSQRSILY